MVSSNLDLIITEVLGMAQLWGGRFTKETDQLVYNFNASISFDQKFFQQDIEGSIVHTIMLAKQGILTKEEKDEILKGLTGIRQDVEDGKLAITEEYEDIHSFVEANLIRRIGDVGKKLHTGRSRNDQVALDMRLYTRLEVLNTDSLLKELLQTLLSIMEEHVETYMPGFTHLQKAQPVTLAHHIGAYFEMFKRDRSRLKDIFYRMNYCPLGAGALAGTTYPLDRAYTASLLGFEGPTLNSMDSVSDRDYVIEFFVRAFHDYDALEPVLRGDHHLEFQRISVCRDRRCLLHGEQYYAPEEKPGYCGAGAWKDGARLRGVTFYIDDHEGASPCLQ